MKTHYILLLVLALHSCYSNGQITQTIGTTEVVIDTLNAEMNVPWEMQLEGTDYLWVTERVGYVSRVDLESGDKTIVLNLTSVIQTGGESGLLGMQLHPDFENTPEVFLVYTYGPVDNNNHFFEKLVKYTFNGSQLVNPVELITGIPAAYAHDGSRLLFLPDNTLLMSTGERYEAELAQDENSLAGKYLRLNTDGSIPSDNPTPGSYVYSMGHRNSQGIVRLPSGKLIISEHGPNSDDELSILEPGKNYGWPLIYGFCDENFENAPCATGLYTEPIHNWSPTIATSDLVYYQNPFFPEWDNRLLMTTLNGQRLVAMQLNGAEDDVVDEDSYFHEQFGRLRDIAIGPNKEIYLATNYGTPGSQAIIRITPPDFTGMNAFSTAGFKVYPTIVTDQVTVRHELAAARLVVIDQNGREVFRDNHTESQQTFQLKLSPGMYYAVLLNGSEIIGRQKIIKQ